MTHPNTRHAVGLVALTRRFSPFLNAVSRSPFITRLLPIDFHSELTFYSESGYCYNLLFLANCSRISDKYVQPSSYIATLRDILRSELSFLLA